MKFEKLALMPEILKAVEENGYTNTTPIQTRAIPAILDGRDILGGAQTGTGKTAAFALPILNKLKKTAGESAAPRALILTPTRELADQVAESFKSYGKNLDLVICKVYGGAKMSTQLTNLKNGTDIVIATPGRLMDHIEKKSINLSKVDMIVLDEADRMLDMGFVKDIEAIMGTMKQKSQNLLFSATYGQDIERLAKQILNNPVAVEVTKRNAVATDVNQILHYVEKGKRFDLLLHLIQEGQWYQVLIFVKTKHTADRVASDLLKAKIPSAAIHGDKSQGARNRALRNFKSGDIQALVATDVAARGIDLHDMSHVVNFELPQIPEDYIHRIGRTGRAGKSGTAISLVSFSEKNQLLKIEKILKAKIPVEVIEGFIPKHDIDKVLTKKSDTADKKSSGKDSRRRSENAGKKAPSTRADSSRTSSTRGPSSKNTSSRTDSSRKSVPEKSRNSAESKVERSAGRGRKNDKSTGRAKQKSTGGRGRKSRTRL